MEGANADSAHNGLTMDDNLDTTPGCYTTCTNKFSITPNKFLSHLRRLCIRIATDPAGYAAHWDTLKSVIVQISGTELGRATL